MTATLKKLMAGDGYSYLTRQVARNDASTKPEQSLGAYYSAKGESPGRWLGAGLAGLSAAGVGLGVDAGSFVTERQMAALFGEGLHPNADAISKATLTVEMAHGATPSAATKKALKAARLGRRFVSDRPHNESSESRLVKELRSAFAVRKVELGLGPAGVLVAAESQQIRSRVAVQVFKEEYGRAPLSAAELSAYVIEQTRQEKAAVAGFDVSFSPVKSISSLWAVADIDTARQIEAIHDEAVAECIAWIESNAAYTRRGRAGVQQVETQGILAAAFTHRDSRAGDPDLHTHVAIANKVQSTDGSWLSLDSAALYEQIVAVSERYNATMERELQAKLGVQFRDKEVPGKRPIREIEGVPADLMDAWSKRRLEIEARTAELTERFLAEHDRMPTAKEHIALAQTANLETREAKSDPRSLPAKRG